MAEKPSSMPSPIDERINNNDCETEFRNQRNFIKALFLLIPLAACGCAHASPVSEDLSKDSKVSENSEDYEDSDANFSIGDEEELDRAVRKELKRIEEDRKKKKNAPPPKIQFRKRTTPPHRWKRERKKRKINKVRTA